jgi:hypothetical protein
MWAISIVGLTAFYYISDKSFFDYFIAFIVFITGFLGSIRMFKETEKD